MKLAVSIVLVLSFLAGCATPGPKVGAASIDLGAPTTLLRSVASEVKMPGDGYGAEPNIAVLSDGTLFVGAPSEGSTTPNALDPSMYLWRSTDHGATWSIVTGPSRVGNAPTALFFSGDSDVATSPDGWVYASDWWIAPPYVAGAQNFNVRASGDGGKTWTATAVTTPAAFTSVDRQWLLGLPKGGVMLEYAYYHQVRNAVTTATDPLTGGGDYVMSLEEVTSTDHGASWGQPVAITLPQSGHEMLHGKPVLLKDGTILAPYVDSSNRYLTDPGVLRVALSHDGGANWEERDVATLKQNSGGLWPVEAAVDDAGVAYVVWTDRVGDSVAVHVASSSDAGQSWTPMTDAATHGLHAVPWIAARGNGTVAVGWYGNWTARGDPQKVDNSTAWDALLAESTNGGLTWAYGVASATPVKVGPFCPNGAQCNGNRELLDYVSLAFDPQGQLHDAFARSAPQGTGRTAHVVVSNLLGP